ncbi:hypothetical protein [Nitratireductor sp. GCM10026969]|uniref:hypothetical protein n=1 Tax=Nitratireductor sp. GCM10026969 TaxID=3252645 RepID=UPI0036205341
MRTIPAHIEALCREFGIEIIDRHRYPVPGQTRAVETMARIYRRHGETHLRMVLLTLMETANNRALLDEVALWMTSDMVRFRGLENIDSEWLELWDRTPVGQLQFICQELSGIVPQRYALGGMMFERVWRRFDKNADQLDLLDDRRRA